MSNIINIQDVMENKISLNEAKKMVIMHNGEAYTFFDEGCTRHVYANADQTKVIKLLQHANGKDFNVEEAEIYAKASDEVKDQMAETKLINGFIEQKFVTPIKFGGRRLSIPQKLFARKCRNEVGWDGDKLVCFDLDEYMKY